MAKIQAIRGMNDILPNETPYWHLIERTLHELTRAYDFQEIRFPIMEKTELFNRGVGEVTDIVEKEMYTFQDRNGDSLSLRPEGTACCIRALLEHGLLHNQTQKVWYLGPFFRHERPQKGRYRQFYQFAMESVGFSEPECEVELILFCTRLFKQLNLLPYLTLELNTLGSVEERKIYREALVKFFSEHLSQLDEDSQRRLHTNPLRILDSKNPDMKELLEQAPKLTDYLDEESRQHFQRVCDLLSANGISYQLNSRLVRGLDYYCHTVFEWTTTHLGAQATVCAGGRYDGLIEQLGGRPTPAVGFAMGMERFIILLQDLNLIQLPANQQDVYFCVAGEKATMQGLRYLEQCRDQFPQLRFAMSYTGSFKSQFKKADHSGAEIAVIVGEDEAEKELLSIKYLREEKPQELMSFTDLNKLLEQRCAR